MSPRGSNPCYRRERAISPRQEPSFSPSLVEPSWAALRSGPLSAAASRVQSAALSASFFLVPNDTQRRCRPRYKLTGRRRQLRTHKAVPAGAAPRMWSTDSTSRPSSHCPGESSHLATPPTRTINTRHASRVEKTQRTYHAAGVRFTAWCAIHGQTALQAPPETITAFSPPRPAEPRGQYPVPAPYYLHLRRDQARAVAGQGEGALVLDRLRFVLLTIRNTLAGLRDRRHCQSASPRHCHRARSSGSKHAKLCATRTAPSFIRPWR